MSTLAFQGSVVDLPDGQVFRAFDVRVPCSPDPEHRVITLTGDAPFAVNLDGLTSVHAIYVDSDHPVTVRLDSSAGSAQSTPLESFHVVSRAVPFTAISLVRQPGVATVVRLIIGHAA